jgi:hypothetical protein
MSPQTPYAALAAAGIPYERLVELFALVKERASAASAGDILDFLKEDLAGPRFSHLPPERRVVLQIGLRALQEYALDVWRLSPRSMALSAVTHSGPYPAPPSGGYAQVAPSGGYAQIPPSGGYAAASPSGAYYAVGPSGAFPALASPRRGVFRRVGDALRSLFGRDPQIPQLPGTLGEVTSALAGQN